MMQLVSGDSQTFRVMELALEGLARRSEVTADNVANMNTPGFSARRVSFEQHVERAAAEGKQSAAEVTVAGGRAHPQENTVDIDHEFTTMWQTSLLRSSLTAAYSGKLDALRSAVAGGA